MQQEQHGVPSRWLLTNGRFHTMDQAAPEEILQTRPLGTMIGGDWVYRQDELV